MRIKVLFAAGMSSARARAGAAFLRADERADSSSIESKREARAGAASPSLMVSGATRAAAAGSARLIGLAAPGLTGTATVTPAFGAGAPPPPPRVFMRCVIRLMYSLAIERSDGSPFVRISMNRSMAWMSSPCS